MKIYNKFIFPLAMSFLVCVGQMAAANEATNSLAQLVTAQNRFGANLFQESLKRDSTKNSMVSPVSAHQALQMLMQGAVGSTFLDLRSTLQLEGLSLKDSSDLNRSFLKDIRDNRKEFALSIANSLWVDQELPVFENYIQNLQQNFFAEANNAYRLSNPGVGGIINKWVENKTNGKIQELLGGTVKLTGKALANLPVLPGPRG